MAGDATELDALRELMAEMERTRDEDLRLHVKTHLHARITELFERVGQVEATTAVFKASAAGSVVQIDGKVFHSIEDIVAWLELHNGPNYTFEHFFEFISMLGTMVDSAKSTDKALEDQHRANKGGHQSVQAAPVIDSFALNTPAFFGKKGQNDLSRLATPEGWTSKDGRRGVVPEAKGFGRCGASELSTKGDSSVFLHPVVACSHCTDGG